MDDRRLITLFVLIAAIACGEPIASTRAPRDHDPDEAPHFFDNASAKSLAGRVDIDLRATVNGEPLCGRIRLEDIETRESGEISAGRAFWMSIAADRIARTDVSAGDAARMGALSLERFAKVPAELGVVRLEYRVRGIRTGEILEIDFDNFDGFGAPTNQLIVALYRPWRREAALVECAADPEHTNEYVLSFERRLRAAARDPEGRWSIDL